MKEYFQKFTNFNDGTGLGLSLNLDQEILNLDLDEMIKNQPHWFKYLIKNNNK